jgi:hypothetical protein
VLGWASNFATVLEAHRRYGSLTQRPAAVYQDELWAVDVPYPLPSAGAKVIVTGRYGRSFTKSSTGIVTDPVAAHVRSLGLEEAGAPAPRMTWPTAVRLGEPSRYHAILQQGLG